MTEAVSGRILVVNADDFGSSPAVDRGILLGHTRGIVTSTSLMTRGQSAANAARLALDHPRLSIGLHVDLCEWVYRDDEWHPRYQVVPTDDAAAVAAEVARQIEDFRRLIGRDPSHLDSHQHVHREEPTKSILLDWGSRLRIPVRANSRARFCGSFYGQTNHSEPYHQAIMPEALADVISSLPPGITELCCHPAEGNDFDSAYRYERATELESLCHPDVRRAIVMGDISLASFADLTSRGLLP